MTATPGPTARAFRFGVLAGEAADGEAWRLLARRTEGLGYSSLLVPDHLDREWGPLVSLAVAAESTTTLRLGTLMMCVDLRRPVPLYKELATLDIVSGGRLEVGLGAGWHRPDFERAGVEMDPPATRIERLDEAATILKQLWAGGSASFQGRHFAIKEAVGLPRPVQRPLPRIAMGGGGKLMLDVAARHADIVALSATLSHPEKASTFGTSASAADFDRRVAWVRQSASKRWETIELACLAFAAAVVTDRQRYGERVLARMFGLPAEEALDSPLAVVGTVDEIVACLERRRDRFGLSYWIVNSRQLDDFAPVVERLAGR